MANSIVTVNTQVQASSELGSASVVSARTWSAEPDGPHDRPVDVYWNGNWVPAFFKDIKAGDFFLILDMNLDPGRCFLAGSDCKRCGTANGHSNFIIMKGMEVVQAPAIKEVEAIALPLHETLKLENN